LPDAEAARAAANAMEARVRTGWPDARVDGFAVQPMISRRQAHEVFAGIASDPTFGTMLMFGAGGTAIEVLRDKAIALPPINSAIASQMILQTRISRLLAGYRDVAGADVQAIERVLFALSEMAMTLPEINELDINPLLANAEGVIALDARVVLIA
jgi:acetyltransferase